MNLFVSYTLRDGCLDLKQLKTVELALADIGSPYIDILHNRSYNRQSFVVRMLRSAEMLVACWTRDFLLSPWVRFELETARQLHIPIIVLNYGGADTLTGTFGFVGKIMLPVLDRRLNGRGGDLDREGSRSWVTSSKSAVFPEFLAISCYPTRAASGGYQGLVAGRGVAG